MKKKNKPKVIKQIVDKNGVQTSRKVNAESPVSERSRNIQPYLSTEHYQPTVAILRYDDPKISKYPVPSYTIPEAWGMDQSETTEFYEAVNDRLREPSKPIERRMAKSRIVVIASENPQLPHKVIFEKGGKEYNEDFSKSELDLIGAWASWRKEEDKAAA